MTAPPPDGQRLPDADPSGKPMPMRELARRSGVSAGTIKHYLREGLLGSGEDVVRTSRNMAYYPVAYVDRVRLVKRLQEDHFLPLREIARLLEGEEGEAKARALLSAENRILERALAGHEDRRRQVDEVGKAYDMPANVLARLAELEVLTPTAEGYDAEDVQIVEAMARFRSGGYDEALGFTVYDTLRYREALAPLVAEEVRVLLDRLTGEVDPDRAAEIISSGERPLRDLIGALHAKLLRAELRRQLDGALEAADEG